MPDTDTVEVTELLEISPDRVDAVGSPANGTEWLILKALDGSEAITNTAGALAEIEKADTAEDDTDKRPDCATCKGSGKIMDGHRKCPKCQGSGVQPQPGDTEKSLAELAAAKELTTTSPINDGMTPYDLEGTAASGSKVPVLNDCPTCKGSGAIADGTADGKTCPDCDGTGKDSAAPPDDELNRVNADSGKITVGDPQGRETVDKAADEDMSKKNVDPNVGGGVDRDKIDAADFAGKDRSFPIVKPGDVSDAASSIGRAGSDNYSTDKLKANIIAIAKRKGAAFVAELPKAWTDDEAEKAAGDGVTFSAPNPVLAAAATQVTDSGSTDDEDDDSTDATIPGSPAWEAIDAQTATDAALALMTAVELLRTFANRETQEVVAGDASDAIDVYMVTDAICAAQSALGTVAQLAFHEGLEAAKSLPDDEVIEKAGRRLAGKTVAALATARDKAKDLANHITGVLGDDDPAKKNKGDGATNAFIANANKSLEDVDIEKLSEEIENMELNELTKVLDAQNEKLVGAIAEALKGSAVQDVDNSASTANAKTENAKAKTRKKKVAGTDDALVDEAEQGDDESASGTNQTTGATKATDDDDAETDDEAAKAELTPEEIEANETAAKARKEFKAAKKAKREAAKKAALTKSIEESLTKVVEQNEAFMKQNADLNTTVETLRGELEGVKKMAAPSTIVRTASTVAQSTARERDELSLEASKYDSMAKETTDATLAAGYAQMAKAARDKLAGVTPQEGK